MGEENKIDYAAVLGDLENDMAELQALMAYIKRKKLGQAITIDGYAAPGALQSAVPISTTLTYKARDAYFGLGVIDAARKYLATTGKVPKSAREIATALVSGGFNTKAKDFKNTVFSVLARADKQDGSIIKVNTDWGLPEWYPNLKRGKSQIKMVPAPHEVLEGNSDASRKDLEP